MKTLAFAAAVVLSLAAPLLSQTNPQPASHGDGQADGDGNAPVHAARQSPKSGAADVDQYKFDEQSRKGILSCRKKGEQADKVIYEKCRPGNVDKYKSLAIEKGYMEADKEPRLSKEIKELASKLALLDSARADVKQKLEAMKDKRDRQSMQESKKLRGIKDQIKDETIKSVNKCKGQYADSLKCPDVPQD